MGFNSAFKGLKFIVFSMPQYTSTELVNDVDMSRGLLDFFPIEIHITLLNYAHYVAEQYTHLASTFICRQRISAPEL